MCGICGVFAPKSNTKPNRKLLDRATDLMAHRGPDGRGVYIAPGIGFGHRRLAVIDPEGSPQPMESRDGRYILTYNGELYNFRQLRRELEAESISFRTKGDTEVVLNALAAWGPAALERFEGMFALAFWDVKERVLLLARDRLGIKPLYYSEAAGKLVFASEFKPIFVWQWISPEPDPLGVAGYLSNYQLTFDGQTIFKDVKSLRSGCYMVADADGSRITRYWKLPLIPSSEKKHLWHKDRLNEAVENLSELMKEAVESHLIADVPVGAFLSGGIDSSVVLTLMSDLYGERVKAYSIGFEDAGFSEFEYSMPLVKGLGLQHSLLNLDSGDYFLRMEELISHKMAPLSTPNEVPLWVLSQHLSKDIKVVLSGEGADELLGGYAPLLRSPHDYSAFRLLRDNPGKMPSDIRSAIRQSLKRQYGRSGFKDLLEHFLIVYNWLTESDRQTVLNGEFYTEEIEEQIRQVWKDRLNGVKDLSIYDRYLYILETEHLCGLLMRLDANTMAASVEGRVPFCDSRLVEFVWGLPFDYKLRWKSDEHRRMSLTQNSLEIAENLDISKFILKEAFKNRIPGEIINRKKKAFPVPLENWLNGEHREFVMKRLCGNEQLAQYLNMGNIEQWVGQTLSTGNGAMKVWMLLSLVMWMENIA